MAIKPTRKEKLLFLGDIGFRKLARMAGDKINATDVLKAIAAIILSENCL